LLALRRGKVALTGVDRELGGGARHELSCEASDRLVVVPVLRRVFDARALGVTRHVELIAVASTAQRGVAGLAVEPGGEDEGVIHGQALGDVHRHRVAVLQRRVAVGRAVVEIAGVVRDLLAIQVHGEPAGLRIDGAHPAAVAVDDAAPEVVPLDQDVVADRAAAAGKPKLVVTERAVFTQERARERVEVRDLVAPVREHHRPRRIGSAHPVCDEPLPRLRGRVGNLDAVVLLVEREGTLGLIVAKEVERCSLPSMDLAAVLGQFDREPSGDEASKRAAGFELGQLAMVADEDKLALDCLNRVRERCELAGRDHPRPHRRRARTVAGARQARGVADRPAARRRWCC
jgi:hypothetical protein